MKQEIKEGKAIFRFSRHGDKHTEEKSCVNKKEKNEISAKKRTDNVRVSCV